MDSRWLTALLAFAAIAFVVLAALPGWQICLPVGLSTLPHRSVAELMAVLGILLGRPGDCNIISQDRGPGAGERQQPVPRSWDRAALPSAAGVRRSGRCGYASPGMPLSASSRISAMSAWMAPAVLYRSTAWRR
jgi:hypothetical protein